MTGQYNQIRSRKNYDKLLESGMFWVFHPELTGTWDKDIIKISEDGNI